MNLQTLNSIEFFSVVFSVLLYLSLPGFPERRHWVAAEPNAWVEHSGPFIDPECRQRHQHQKPWSWFRRGQLQMEHPQQESKTHPSSSFTKCLHFIRRGALISCVNCSISLSTALWNAHNLLIAIIMFASVGEYLTSTDEYLSCIFEKL